MILFSASLLLFFSLVSVCESAYNRMTGTIPSNMHKCTNLETIILGEYYSGFGQSTDAGAFLIV